MEFLIIKYKVSKILREKNIKKIFFHQFNDILNNIMILLLNV